MSTRILLLCGFVALCGSFVSSSRACSVCSCGDPSTTACSKEVVAEDPHWAVAFESRYFSKSNLNDAGDGTESHVQAQFALAVSRTLRHGFELYARLPYVNTALHTTGAGDEAGRINRSGAGDLDMLARYSLHSASVWTPSLSVGIKAPTGNNDLSTNGARITEHAQSGTGSWDGYAVASLSRQGATTLSGAAGYRFNGVNRFHQRYGQATWLQVMASRPAVRWLRLDGGLRLRSAARDNTPQGFDPNSGGTMLSGLVSTRFDLGHGLAFQLSGAVPVVSNLAGTQKEHAQLDGGVVMTF